MPATYRPYLATVNRDADPETLVFEARDAADAVCYVATLFESHRRPTPTIESVIPVDPARYAAFVAGCWADVSILPPGAGPAPGKKSRKS